MNINLRDVVCTSQDGERFVKLNECYIRGSSIKYLRLPDEAVDRVVEEESINGGRGRGRGGDSGRGRVGRGDGRGGRGRGVNSGGRGRGGRTGDGGGRGRGRGRS